MKQGKEQQGIGDMEKQTYEMMPTWSQSENLDIQLVGKPRQGMPIAGVAAPEGPNEVIPLQSAQDTGIIRDVLRVIEIDETIVKDRPISTESYQAE
jgi:hypothetical protein